MLYQAILCLLVSAVFGRHPIPGELISQGHLPIHAGMSNVPLIINGDDADVGEWPWQCAEMVYIAPFYYFNCGCSVISNNKILTAGHCTDGWSTDQLFFLLGAHDLEEQTEGNPTGFATESFAIHPDFGYDIYGVPLNDVSVATLATAVEYDDYIQPVALAPEGADDMFVDQECYITGWGDTTAGFGVSPDVLQEAQIRVVPLKQCQEMYSSTPYEVYDDSICIFKLQDSDDHTASCYGDSGGPLVCRESASSEWIQAGLTSWGYPPCGVDGSPDGLPSVYMAVGYASNRQFICDESGVC